MATASSQMPEAWWKMRGVWLPAFAAQSVYWLSQSGRAIAPMGGRSLSGGGSSEAGVWMPPFLAGSDARRWLDGLHQAAVLLRVDAQRLAQVLGQHRAAHVAVPVAALSVEPERRVAVPVLVVAGVGARAVDPLPALFVAALAERVRDGLDEVRVEGPVRRWSGARWPPALLRRLAALNDSIHVTSSVRSGTRRMAAGFSTV